MINDFFANLDLIDAWRVLNPETSRFTWRQKKPEVHCRLDFFLVNQITFCNIVSADILPGYKTDHSMMTLQVSLHSNNSAKTPTKHESFLSKFLASKKPSRLVYKKLVSAKSGSPIRRQQKWQEDLTLTTKQEINWKEVNQIAFQCTKSTRLITFNFKFLHRRISTNNYLKKIGLIDSEKCTFCERETENLAHLIWAPKTQ